MGTVWSTSCSSSSSASELSKMKMPADGAVTDAFVAESGTRSVHHLLVVPYPAKGHNLAALQLARKLLPYGVHITMANIFGNMSQDHLDICRAEHIKVENLGIRPAHGPGPSNLPFFGDVESVQGETELLVEKILSPAVTCIVSDVFLGWTQNVADRFGIPNYVLCTSNAKFLAAFLYMPELAAQGIVPVELSRASEIVHIHGLPPTRCADLSPAVQAAFGLQFFAQYVHRCCQPAMEAAAGFFVSSCYELEASCIDAVRSYPYQRAQSKGSNVRNVFPVGPLVHDTYLQLLRCGSTEGRSTFMVSEAPYLRWLDRQPTGSVLYVNFGSVVSLSIQQIHELALGLEASSQPFLLVVRPKDSHENHPLVPESFSAHAQETGFVQSEWVSQVDVLSHPAVGGFLSHCGWNSTLESICLGVPLLAWPIQADQKLNCRFLVDEAHAALEVQKGANAFVSKEEVVRAARQLMVEPEGEIVRKNVGKLRDKLKEALSKDGSAQGSIETFLAELRSYNSPVILEH